MQQYQQALHPLLAHEVIIMPTDTIYGLVCRAVSTDAVEHIYTLKNRDLSKPPVILIASYNDLETLGIILSPFQKEYSQGVWPGGVSLIIDVRVQDRERLAYLHRGQNSLAIRMTDLPLLADLIQEIGPLATSSANSAEQPFAQSIEQAHRYFGEAITTYVDDGPRPNVTPSRIIDLRGDEVVVIR